MGKFWTAKKIIAAVVSVVVVGSGTAAALNFSKINNTYHKLTMDSDEYARYVLQKQIDQRIDTYTEGLVKVTEEQNLHVKALVGIEASEDFIDEVDNTDYFKSDILEKVTLSMDAYQLDDHLAIVTNFGGINGDVLTLELIIDTEDVCMYARIPQLNEDYIKYDVSDELSEEELEAFSAGTVKLTQQDTETMNRLMKKYAAVALESIEDVEEGTETVNIEGVSQKFTTLEIEFTEEMFGDMISSIADEMLDDEELEDFALEFMDNNDIDEDLWDDFLDQLDEVSDEIYDEFDDDEEFMTVVYYVDSDGEIQGMEMTAYDTRRVYSYNENTGEDYYEEKTEIVFRMLTAQHFNKFAIDYGIEYDGDDMMTLSGTGTKVLGKISGTFNLDIEDEGDIDIILEKCLFSASEVSGKVSFDLEDLLDLLDVEDDEDIAEDMMCSFDFKVTNSEETMTITFDDTEGKSVSVTFSLVAETIDEADAPAIPGNKDCVDIEDEEDFYDYIDDCEYEDLRDDLADMGFKKGWLADFFEEIFETDYSDGEY